MTALLPWRYRCSGPTTCCRSQGRRGRAPRRARSRSRFACAHHKVESPAMRGLAGALAVGVIACSGSSPAPPLPEVTDPIPLVDPTIGAGGLGYTYGAVFVGA